jgi:uncharacterized protein (DUF58 family)
MNRNRLLDPAFIHELEALRLRLVVRASSGQSGERATRKRGGTAEFAEHRAYGAGDDVRRMDWLAFARTGTPVLKLFRAEEDTLVRLVIDTSASLGVGSPAKRIAASIAYMALASSERAQVLGAGDGMGTSFEPARGRGSLHRLLRELDELNAAGATGKTDLARAIEAVVKRSPRPGMLVLLSDFLDPGPFDVALARAVAAGHQVALVQILAPDELEPNYEGNVAFEDVETGNVVLVTVDDRARDAYLARLEGLFARLRSLAKRHRGAYVRTSTSETLLAPLRRFVAGSVD